MPTQHERRKAVFDQLELIAVDTLLDRDWFCFAEDSFGLVCRYGGTMSSRTNKVSDPTAIAAVLDGFESIAKKKAREWSGLASSVHRYLLAEAGKSEFDRKRDRLLAWLFFHRVLLGKRLSHIAQHELYGDGHISAANLSRYFTEVLDVCVRFALDRGLIS